MFLKAAKRVDWVLCILRFFMKMNVIRPFLMVLALVVGCVCLSGCTTPEQESDIPWNTPASWEGQGPLGGMMNGGY